MDIIDVIGCGRQNAITREALVMLTGLSDRAVREAIEQARHEGWIIINQQDGRGYYLTADLNDIYRQYKTNERRFKSIAHQQKYLRRRLKAAGVL